MPMRLSRASLAIGIACEKLRSGHLDILQNRWMAVQARLLQRLLYYASSMYVDQIPKGVGYVQLTNSISICFLNGDLHRSSDQAYHCYRMTDQSSGRMISDGIEVHTVELPKYNLSEATISTASSIEPRVFFFASRPVRRRSIARVIASR